MVLIKGGQVLLYFVLLHVYINFYFSQNNYMFSIMIHVLYTDSMSVSLICFHYRQWKLCFETFPANMKTFKYIFKRIRE